MADDKKKRGGLDRKLVSGLQDYEVRHVAKKAGLDTAAAKKAIDKFGPSRKSIEANLASLAKKPGLDSAAAKKPAPKPAAPKKKPSK